MPGRNRLRHGGALLHQIDELQEEADLARKAQHDAGIEEGLGLQVEFESFSDIELAFERLARERYIELAFERLARERSGIELLNVRHEEKRTLATVFVPDGKLDIFENLIRAYLDESKDTKTGRPKNHTLLDAISAIRAASLQALWTDEEEFPNVEEGSLWWEVWLPVRGDRQAVVNAFLLGIM